MFKYILICSFLLVISFLYFASWKSSVIDHRDDGSILVNLKLSNDDRFYGAVVSNIVEHIFIPEHVGPYKGPIHYFDDYSVEKSMKLVMAANISEFSNLVPDDFNLESEFADLSLKAGESMTYVFDSRYSPLARSKFKVTDELMFIVEASPVFHLSVDEWSIISVGFTYAASGRGVGEHSAFLVGPDDENEDVVRIQKIGIIYE